MVYSFCAAHDDVNFIFYLWPLIYYVVLLCAVTYSPCARIAAWYSNADLIFLLFAALGGVCYDT